MTATAAEHVPRARANVRQLLLVLGESVIELIAAPRGLDAQIREVVILDADDDLGECAGDLVLVVGARGAKAMRSLQEAAAHGASAVAVKTSADGGKHELKRMAADAGLPVLGVRPEVRWSQLYALARGFLADAQLAAADHVGQPADLFALAQTVAALAGGSTTIEDSANRVLAYSRSDDEVDELRRLSILGWQSPPEYLAMLRKWGVFDRLRAGEDVVHVAERPDLGIKRRMVVGIHADRELLGSIWLQEGREGLAPGAEAALRGAARTAAFQLVRRRTGSSPTTQVEQSLLSWMFEGNIDAQTFADCIGADLEQPAVITVFSASTKLAHLNRDRSAVELRRAMLTNLISVQAAARRRSSFVANDGARICLLVSGLPPQSAEKMTRDLATDIVGAARQSLGLDIYGAVGSVASSLATIAESKSDADRVLDILIADGHRKVAAIADVRGEALVREAIALIRENPHIRDPRISGLIAYDNEHRAGLVESLRAYLDQQCNVRAAARDLHVHPNTLRYRVKRAETVSGLDFTNSYECLFTRLQLLLDEN